MECQKIISAFSAADLESQDCLFNTQTVRDLGFTPGLQTNWNNGYYNNNILANFMNDAGTKLYDYDENCYNNDKKKGCELCGEFGSWTKCYQTVKHSKKNCPYHKLFDLDNAKDICLIKGIAEKELNKQKAEHLEHQQLERLNLSNELSDLKNKYNTDTKKLKDEKDTIDKELKLFHRIMPQDTIKERLNQHHMMMEELNTKEKEVQDKIDNYDDRCQDIESKEIMLKVHQEIINKKVKNLKIQHNKKVIDLEDKIEEIEERYEEILGNHIVKYNDKEQEFNKLVHKHTKLECKYSRMNKEIREIEKEKEEIVKKCCRAINGKKETEICVICQEDCLTEKMELSCGHKFHSKCFLSYCLHQCRENNYKMTYNCPLCKAECLKLNSYH